MKMCTMSLSQAKRIKLQTELTASYSAANFVTCLSTILLPWSFLRTQLPSIHSKDGESSTTQVSLVRSGFVYLFFFKTSTNALDKYGHCDTF